MPRKIRVKGMQGVDAMVVVTVVRGMVDVHQAAVFLGSHYRHRKSR
jgi:hypothetical protein